MTVLRADMRAKLVAVVMALALAILGGQQLLDSSESSVDPADPGAASSAERFSDLPSVQVDSLPAEARETLDRIESNGPYPYRKDGSTFQNREGLLPDQEIGHYREFTVDTPGSPDRGARRIVAGDDGERFYTADHYASFSEIVS